MSYRYRKFLSNWLTNRAVKCQENGEEHVCGISTGPLHLPCVELEKLNGHNLNLFSTTLLTYITISPTKFIINAVTVIF